MKEWRIEKIVLGKWGGAKGVRDAVDTSLHLGGQKVFKTFEMAIRHNRRPTQTELETVFCRWIYLHLRSEIFFVALLRRGGAIAAIAPAPQWNRQSVRSRELHGDGDHGSSAVTAVTPR